MSYNLNETGWHYFRVFGVLFEITHLACSSVFVQHLRRRPGVSKIYFLLIQQCYTILATPWTNNDATRTDSSTIKTVSHFI